VETKIKRKRLSLANILTDYHTVSGGKIHKSSQDLHRGCDIWAALVCLFEVCHYRHFRMPCCFCLLYILRVLISIAFDQGGVGLQFNPARQ